MDQSATEPPRWYCLRSQPRHQHLAARHLRSLGIEVFNPDLRCQRSTRQGAAGGTAPLFLDCLFARYALRKFFRRARCAFGVSDVLRFSSRGAELLDAAIARLREVWPHSDALQPPQPVEVGEPVGLAAGLFHGLEAQVIALLPARQRVKILADFLGGRKEAEVDVAAVLPVITRPLAV